MATRKFLKNFILDPFSVGAICPSSKFLGKALASQVRKLPRVPNVAELGPGNGAITKNLVEIFDNLSLVEINPCFARTLGDKFHNASIRNECALEFLRNINDDYAIISSIPLINNKHFKKKMTEELNILYRKGHLKWLITYTYGISDPFDKVVFKNRKKVSTVLLNIPPAHVWIYS